uniref:CATSPERE first N-terminal domain-containing protein n=1 Tax=Nannospalax galili TaxID=1026970 RepID=A0A8C6Q9E2_NANGA
MSVREVAVLLCWLCSCGSALWRYYTTNLAYRIFSTRSTIRLEYEGTSFDSWNIPEACNAKNIRAQNTELRCTSPGFHAIKPNVKGSEEERYLAVDNSHICFMWYYTV